MNTLPRLLRVALAWCAKAYLWLFIRAIPVICYVCPVDFIDSLCEKGAFIAVYFDKGNWYVRTANHHYSRSRSLRRALCAALKKVQPEPRKAGEGKEISP
jgi:hypothetical protein